MSTFIIGAIVFGLLFLAVFSMIKKSKSGNGNCGGSCPGCGSKDSCSSKLTFKK